MIFLYKELKITTILVVQMTSVYPTLEPCIMVVESLSYLGPKVWDIVPERF